MGKITNFYKVVSPTTATAVVQDNQLLDSGYAATNNFTWYARLVQGSGARLARYNEYNIMDTDVEIARALDIIAEEMTSKNMKTKLPFDIDMLIEDGQDIDDTVVATIRAALRHWSKLHGFDENRLFKLARNTVKYGDCFFRKKSHYKRWEWIPASAVVGAIIDQNDVTNVLGYQIRTDLKEPNANNPMNTMSNMMKTMGGQGKVENVPIDELVVFSINDDMSDTAPFGDSVLRTVYKTHKQKELLEDAIIIYRIQRAPERRVFYVDVGKMPPHRVKTYLETLKNELKQKKIPSMNTNGQPSVDSIYNPHCLSLDTLIPLLDGRILKLSDIINEYDSGKELWAYSVNPETGKFVPGVISWAGVTRRDTDVIKLTFDNGKSLICTPDHKIPVQGKGFIEAKDLTTDDSLFPFNTRHEPMIKNRPRSTYTQVYDTAENKWVFVHRAVAANLQGNIKQFTYHPDFTDSDKGTIHHVNYNRFDNSPSNLVLMNSVDHILYHSIGAQNENFIRGRDERLNKIKNDTDYRAALSEKLSNVRLQYFEDNPDFKNMCIENLLANRAVTINQVKKFDDYCFSRCEIIIHNNPLITFSEFITKLFDDADFVEHYREINIAQSQPDKCSYQYKINTNLLAKPGLLRYLKQAGYNSFRDYKNTVIQNKVRTYKCTNDDFDYIRSLILNISPLPNKLCTEINKNDQLLSDFNTWYKDRLQINVSYLRAQHLNHVATFLGFENWRRMLVNIINYNHRITSIEVLSNRMDVGTLTIDGKEIHHNYHTFAIDAGIYVKNSMCEDIYLAQRCLSLDTQLEIVYKGPTSLFDVIRNHANGIKQQVVTVDQDTGERKICDISWADVTKRNTEIVRIEFLNNQSLECTPDHKVIMHDLSEIQAIDLKPGDLIRSDSDHPIAVKHITVLEELANTGCITVNTCDNNHNFLLTCGIFVRNSDGVGSKVEVLPGGAQLGENSDLDYFNNKVLRGLRVPLQWMGARGDKDGALFNDGKLGAAYIEEQQFAKFIERLQFYVHHVLDKEFKKFLRASNINIDQSLFRIMLPVPSNYVHYKQAELDQTLLSIISTAESIPWMSKRFIARRYLQLTEDEVLTNEKLVKEERGFEINADQSLKKVYGPPPEPGMEGMGGLGGPMGGPDMGMGGDMGMPGPGMEGAPPEPGAPMAPITPGAAPPPAPTTPVQ